MLKKVFIGITAIAALVVSSPARAEDFTALLQTIMTPDEAEIHKKLGDAAATQMARQVCSSIDSGVSIREFATQISQSLVRQGLPQEQLQVRAMYSGKVIAAGVASFCPQHISQLLELQAQ